MKIVRLATAQRRRSETKNGKIKSELALLRDPSCLRSEILGLPVSGRKSMTGLRITDVRAYPTSFPVDPKDSVTLGIGRTVKRDSAIVKVSTPQPIPRSAEAHHCRFPRPVPP